MNQTARAALIVLALGLGCPGSGSADDSSTNLLPVDVAAQRVGETVTFEAEIMGVALSPRTKACYVNFGDAYPRQVLSVLLPPEHGPAYSSAVWQVGNTVRVTGRIDATPRGPVMKVTATNQFQGVTPSLRVALDENGEGTTFERKLAWTLQDLVRQEKFDEVERTVCRWRQDREKLLDGAWKIAFFYEAIGPFNYTTQGVADFFAVLDRWSGYAPDSVTPHIIKADTLHAQAWKARGGGYAVTVTPERWREFKLKLDEARAELELVQAQGEVCPKWYDLLLTIAREQQWPRRDYEALFQRAVARWPDYYYLYQNKAFTLMPRWYGREGEWEAFAKDLAVRDPDGLGSTLYTRIGLFLEPRYEGFFKDSTYEWPLMKRGFDQLIARYPESVNLLNIYALRAGRAGDQLALRDVMRRMGERFDMELWATWENVELARNWAEGVDDRGKNLVLFKGNPPEADGSSR